MTLKSALKIISITSSPYPWICGHLPSWGMGAYSQIQGTIIFWKMSYFDAQKYLQKWVKLTTLASKRIEETLLHLSIG